MILAFSLISFSDIILIPTNIRIPKSDYSPEDNIFRFHVEIGNIIDQKEEIYSLAPNPYMPKVHHGVELRFRLAKGFDDVELVIMNERGQQVRTIQAGRLPDGDNKILWDGKNENGESLASGIYLVYVQTDHLIGPVKLALLK